MAGKAAGGADGGPVRAQAPPAGVGRVGDWGGGARRGGVAVGRRLSPYAGASFPAVRSVSSHRSSNRTCRFPASGFLPTHQAFALDRSTHRLGASLKLVSIDTRSGFGGTQCFVVPCGTSINRRRGPGR